MVVVDEQQSTKIQGSQAEDEVLSQDDPASSPPSLYGTANSSTTKATTVDSNNGDQLVQGGGLAQGHAPGIALQAAGNTLPLGTPLTTAFIGAQFVNEMQQIILAPTPEEQENHRLARIAVLRDAFLELGIDVPDDILVRIEHAAYDLATSQIIYEEFAARYPREHRMASWLQAEDVWNTLTGQFRDALAIAGTLFGWDDLEQLPFTE